MKQHVAITGANSGVGRACTQLLSQNGYSVLACVREKAHGLELERQIPGDIHAVIMDLRDQDSIKHAAMAAADIVGENGLNALVNSAANLYCGPLEYFPREQWFEQYDVNVFGTMALTREMLPLVRLGGGRIINIGGVGGGIALPFYGAIASSKIALEALNDCLRRELHPFGIHVIIIEPGGIDTPANDKMRYNATSFLHAMEPLGQARYGRSMERFTRWADAMHKRSLRPEQVARVVFKALRAGRPKTRYRIGWDSRAVGLLSRFLPDRFLDRILLWRAYLPVRFGAWHGRK